MEQPPASPEIIQRKKLNPWLLWLALLGPIALMGGLTLLASTSFEFDFMSAGMGLGWLAILGGWILIGVVLFKRVSRVGYIFTLIGYPILQITVCFALFFVGCLMSLDGNWGHGAPDSWVEEQERLRRENPIDPVELEKAKQELEEHLKRQEEQQKAKERPPEKPNTEFPNSDS